MGEPRHTGTAQKKAFTATQDECVKKLVQVTADALTNEALQLLFVSVQHNNLDLCAFYAIRWLLFNLPISSEEIVVNNCLEYFPHVWGNCELHFLVCLLFADCQGNSQKAVTTTCTSILKRHLIFDHFHSVQLGAAICMCAQQIFFDGSAKKWSFTPAFESKQKFTSAFERAVAVFSKQASASGFLDEIEPWVDRHKGDFRNLKSDTVKRTNMAQEVADMIKKYRPLIFGEVKG
ncbi:hypothetical protein B0H13DRAFT_1955024 [Mycena leptocephala]|nr:hypothetical protein B0H13DRAFT_1955024 [Mycena leptocephala]